MKNDFAAELFANIREAHAALRPGVAVTPLAYSPRLSAQTGCEIYLKCEHLQHTGSFKFRGASNKIRLLTSEQREKGVVTASSGNHGQGVALAGKLAGVPVTVYATTCASALKLEAIRGWGAEVITLDTDPLRVELEAAAQASQTGRTYISPYNDADVIAGQGTIGTELIEQLSSVDAVFVAVGGGGLIAGIAGALKHLVQSAEIVGCWPEKSPIMERCLAAGKIIEVDEEYTLSDGTAGNLEPDTITFPLCQQWIDRKVLVNEDEIRQAMKAVARYERWMIEGAAGVALAGAIKLASEFQGKKVAVILCGRNILLETFIGAVQ
jgi:threonine dehydratase